MRAVQHQAEERRATSIGHSRLNFSLLFAITMWGGVFVAGRVALEGFSPMFLAGTRYLVAAPILLLILPAADRTSLRQPGRQRGLLLVAAIFHALNLYLWTYGLQFTTASHSVLIYATPPIWAAFFAAAIGLERLQKHILLGALIAFVGVGLTIGRGIGVTGTSLFGDVLTGLGAASFAASTVAISRAFAYYRPITGTVALALFGSVISIVPTVISINGIAWDAIAPLTWAAMIYSILAGFAFGQIFWFRGISQVGPTQATVYLYLQPVVGIGLAAILLGERLGTLQLVGAVVILLGVAVAQGRASQIRARFTRVRSEIGLK